MLALGDLTSGIDLLEAPGAIVAGVSIVLAAVLKYRSLVLDLIRVWKVRTKLSQHGYTEDDIERALRFYVRPDCASIDPAVGDDPEPFGAKETAFDALDRFLWRDAPSKHLILLAGSGMGKTSLLLNYYARLRWSRRRSVEIVNLGDSARSDGFIEAIQSPEEKVLLLDAFDEDQLAIVDHKARLQDLLRLASRFRRVVITCRTQFFHESEEIPTRADVVRLGVRDMGEQKIQKLYLSPLNRRQTDLFIRRSIPWRQRSKRRSARELVAQVPTLISRPMILRHLTRLLDSEERPPKDLWEIYERIVDDWVSSERHPTVGSADFPDRLRRFSRALALDLYTRSEERGAEAAPAKEIADLARRWEIDLQEWELTGRSLLNRDAHNRYKFSHRSILEFLYVEAFLALPANDRPRLEWTDHMRACAAARIGPALDFQHADLRRVELRNRDLRQVDLREADLREADLRGSDLRGANLRRAKLQGVRTERSRIGGAEFWEVELESEVEPRSGVELVRIPGGEFEMGSPSSEQDRFSDEGPQHRVRVEGFLIGRYPVTVQEYRRFFEANARSDEPKDWDQQCASDPRRPVIGVNWHQARAFAKWCGSRLASEAEWEYAARAGTTDRFVVGDSESDLDRIAWYSKNSQGVPHVVGEKEPNPWGLYDVLGNVWEWVEDDMHADYAGAPQDGSAWIDALRGSGLWAA